MNRRHALAVLLTLCAMPLPFGARGQQARKIRRIGWLLSRSRPESIETDYVGGLARGLRELGYVEGRDFSIEWRFANGDHSRLPTLAAELVRLNPDLIVATGSPAALAAKRATETIPIVIAGIADPVASGLVESLRRPGKNITGVTNLVGDTSSKHIELLRAVLPKLSRIATLANPTNPGSIGIQLKSIREAAKSAGVSLVAFEASTPGQIDTAFRAITRERLRALIVVADPMFVDQARQFAELAMVNRVVAIFAFRQHVMAGGLMSYGENLEVSIRGAAPYVDKILKGVIPADPPVEQATRLELVINMKTAKALGITIPQSVLVRADRVIE